jgi:UDP-GlcNAc:undecaprenyl-phosphate GlcNAc-1-phosphate transferase
MAFVFILKLTLSFFISFFLTLYLVPLFSKIAYKLGVLDKPDGKVKLHEKPVPYLGGVAVYFGFLTTLALVFPFDNKITFLLIGSTLLLFIGLIDDLLQIKPYQKFFWQTITALCFLKAGLYLKEAFFLDNFWSIPLSFLWILTIINAFNLVDVMDGLATTLATCATFTFMLLAFLFGQYQLALLLAIFLGALLAFLWYNRPPASIYLGDAGSLFIGGFLGTVPFLFNWSSYTPLGFIIPIIVLAIPILEITTLILIRTYKKIPFYNGSPDHFSIYLQQGGWSKYEILTFVFVISGLFLVLSLLFALNKISFALLSFLFLTLVFFWLITIWNNARRRSF